MLSLKFLGKLRDFGLLVMRVGLGVMFILHGSDKMFGGPTKWMELGGAMSLWHVTFWPVFWGFMSAFAEFAGGILLVLGFMFRPTAIMLTINMAVATTMHLHHADTFAVYSHAAELGIVFFGLIFVGPGRFSIDGE